MYLLLILREIELAYFSRICKPHHQVEWRYFHGLDLMRFRDGDDSSLLPPNGLAACYRILIYFDH